MPFGGIFDGIAECFSLVECYFDSERYQNRVRRSHFALLVVLDRLASLTHQNFDSAQDDTLKIGGVFNALKTSGSYCYGYALKLPSSLQSSSVAESNGLGDKTFYQKSFCATFFKKWQTPLPTHL